MLVFEVVIALLPGGAGLAALARRIGAPYLGDAAFQRVEAELDWTELGWAQVVGAGRSVHGTS